MHGRCLSVGGSQFYWGGLERLHWDGGAAPKLFAVAALGAYVCDAPTVMLLDDDRLLAPGFIDKLGEAVSEEVTWIEQLS